MKRLIYQVYTGKRSKLYDHCTASVKAYAKDINSKEIPQLPNKINKHVESMALNKVNIEFLRKQMDKVLEDIEKLKDANREMKYTNGRQQ